MKRILFLAVFVASAITVTYSQTAQDYKELNNQVQELQARVDSLDSRLQAVTMLALALGGDSESKMSAESLLLLMALMANSDSYDSPDVVEPFEQKPPPVIYPGNKDGASGGSGLDMAGWRWDAEPRPNDTSSESGEIVFEIRIDDKGELVSVKTLERSVSSTIALLYQKEVEQLTFSKTSNSTSAPTTTGKITFIIKAK